MKLWGGRFTGNTAEEMAAFGDSLPFDRRLADADVRGSLAWAEAITAAGVLTAEEGACIREGLLRVRRELAEGGFAFQPSDEDIHTAVERRLGELVGPVAGKLHTGRSRNDQVATDLRLYVLDRIPGLRRAVRGVQEALVAQAEAHPGVALPGYTHGQPAQPLLLAHWFLSHFWPLERDLERLSEIRRRVAICPLGSAALAGTPLPIDREALARALGFDRASDNSLDAVADRDFVVELLAWAALTASHLSRLAADLVTWSAPEYGFVELDDAYATGSSIMPQKKNPDSLELIRARAGRLLGNLVALLAVLKGLPSGYNKDLQEDKEPLFDSLDTLELALQVAAGAVGTLRVRPERMAAALDDLLLATELADYLAGRGIPFREAHALVGQAVRLALQRGVGLRDLSLEYYRSLSPAFGADLYGVLDVDAALARRRAHGGTAPSAVAGQLQRARERLAVEPR
ncbi:MAG: argininosuccinate lyase [Anaerolineae bacterium]|nr:argininosuccinate lyase [Anaerolineae bacterium]